MGKELETAVVMKVGPTEATVTARVCSGLSPYGSSCCGGGYGLPSSPGSIRKPAGPCPGHLSAWFWAFLFCFSVRKKKQETERMTPPPSPPKLAHSNTLGQTLDTHPRWREALDQPALKLKAAEKNPMLPHQRELTCPVCGSPPPPAVPTPSPLLSLPKERCILGFIIFF